MRAAVRVAIAAAVLLAIYGLRLGVEAAFTEYVQRIILLAGINVILAVGLNLINGTTGQFSIGHAGFMAVGAYGAAFVGVKLAGPVHGALGSGAFSDAIVFNLALLAGALFAGVSGLIVGMPSLRLRGDYLAVVTLGFGEIIRLILLNWQDLTGGPNGIVGIPGPSFFGLPFNSSEKGFAATFGIPFSPTQKYLYLYYVILALALLTNWVSLRLRRLPIGRAWEALREDEIACRALGINTTTTKLTAFAMGAMFGGFAGAFFATRQGFISPESFTFHESALVLAIVVLGGMGSQLGVALAALAMIGGFELFRGLEQYRMLVFGMAMVLLMIWRPRGLIGHRAPTVFLKHSQAISSDLVKEGKG